MRDLAGTVVRVAFHLLGAAVLLGAALALHSCIGDRPAAPESRMAELTGPPIVAVGLTAAQDVALLTVAVAGPWRLVGDDDEAVLASGPTLPPTGVRALPDGLQFGDRALRPARALRLLPDFDGTLEVRAGEGRPLAYRGALRLHKQGRTRVSAENLLDLESYLRGVIAAEMPAEWPAEALAAQAIAARTYAASSILLRRPLAQRPQAADVADDQSSQVYGGRGRECAAVDAAVQATRGVVLLHEGRVLRAYFHSTCGGRTARAADVLPDAADIPPLAGVDCPYCARSPYRNWEVALDWTELGRLLFPADRTPPRPSSVSLEDVAAGDRVRRISVALPGGRPPVSMEAALFRQRVGAARVRSSCFQIAGREGKLVLTGHGFGHGAGLCQWGAQGLASQGHRAADIVTYYYPSAQLVRLY